MTNYSWVAATLALVGAGLAAPAAAQPILTPPPMHPNPAVQQAMAAASKATRPYPTFAQIPPAPTNVRSVEAWRTSVTHVKSEGAKLAEAAANEPWTLSDTEGWAASKRAKATPPPAITTPSSQSDTEAFAAAMRARAMPPAPKR